ncbi:MAG: glycosyltransferase family 4 protein [Alphaproteobacteria bacterium]
MTRLPQVIVTNFKRRVTGVTTTALRVSDEQKRSSSFSVAVCGPNQDLNYWELLSNGWRRPTSGSDRIWHVRRDPEMMLGLFAKHVLRQPIKLIFTSAAIRKHSWFPSWLISKMDAVIATTELAASFVPHVKAVVGHGVDTQTFKPNLSRADEPLRLICVGRIRPEKGTDLIVDALCEILPRYPKVVVEFAGLCMPKEQAFFDQLKNRLSYAGVADRVTWQGEVPPKDLPAKLAAAHILLAAPTYEGFGLTPFEAMACGLAVVCTDTGAFAHAVGVPNAETYPVEHMAGVEWKNGEVRQGSSGLFVNTGDLKAFADAVAKLLDDPTLRQFMATNAVSRVHEEFTIRHEAASIEKVYQEMLTINA